MSETPGTPAATPETPAATGSTPPATEGAAPAPTDGKGQTWQGEYDPERAARLVANLRAEIAELKTKSAPAPKEEPATGSTAADDRLAALEKRAVEADRRAIAAETGVPAELLTGTDEAAMKAQAEALIKWAEGRAPAGTDPALPGKPRPALTPGHGGEAEPTFDPGTVAKRARLRF